VLVRGETIADLLARDTGVVSTSSTTDYIKDTPR
jgi:hypothetical protein